MPKLQQLLDHLGKLPWLFVINVIAVSMIGVLMMYDAANGEMHPLASKQALHLVVFAFAMILIGLIDLRTVLKVTYPFYLFSLFLLVVVNITGHNAMGATRWIDLNVIKLQPSELMKLAIIMALAKYFHVTKYRKITHLSGLFIPLLMIALPTSLIVIQPDLGTAIITISIGSIMLFLAGVRLWKFITAGIAIIGVLPVLWHNLYDYQKQRIITFLNPESDSLGEGYNIIQSKIAIGSGGIMGKGMLSGTQAQLAFLPENQTDFVFAMFAEEFGFVGVIVLFVLYLGIIVQGVSIAMQAKNQFSRLLAFGIVSLFSLHAIINIAMVCGLLPVVGIPLPLISYGGTIMATILISFGLLINVKLNSKTKLADSYLSIF